MVRLKHLVLLTLFTTFAGTALPTLAAPEISISSMYDVLKPGADSMTKRIYNTGDSTAFVRVELLEINTGDGPNPQEKPQTEISGNVPVRNRLIVTPMRLIIPPSGFQTVRILWPGERNKERYFRIRFTPVIPAENDGFGLDKTTADTYRKQTLQAGLNVLTGYGSVVIVQPDKPLFKTTVDKASDDNIRVRNNGNATISLDNLRHCRTANTDCGTVSREFILPGKSHTIYVKNGFKTSFTLIEGNSARALNY